MKNILFNGAFTIHSAGDDAALEALLTVLKQQPTPHDFKATVLCRHPNADFENAFGVKTVQNLEYPSKEESLNRWLRGLNVDDSQDILLRLIEYVEAADLLVLGAGNFINENSFGLFRGMLPRLCLSAFLAKTTATPCLLYGMSASELSSPLALRMAQWLFDNVSAVTFREESSLRLLQNLGIIIPEKSEVLPDPVLCSSCAPPGRIQEILARENIPLKHSAPRLAVSLREFHHKSGDFHHQYIHSLREVLDTWTANGGEILFIPHCTYELAYPHTDDRYLAEELRASLKFPEQVYSIRSQLWPWETEGLYATCDLALCTRLHAGVFACKQGIPTIALGYEPKVVGFWEMLGLHKYCLPLESSSKEISTALEKGLKDFPQTDVQERIQTLKAQAQRYADIVMSLI